MLKLCEIPETDEIYYDNQSSNLEDLYIDRSIDMT